MPRTKEQEAELQALKAELSALMEKNAQFSSVEPRPEKVIQEQSPLISDEDRALIKRYAQSDDVAIKYLQKKNPGADVRMINGQLTISAPGQDKYVADPDTGPFSKDILKDFSDVAYDAVDTVGSAVGTGVGGLAGLGLGGLAGPGTAAVGAGVGAATGGGLAGYYLEKYRQERGKELGLPQEFSDTDAYISGGIGALSPLMMGAQAEVKNTAKVLGAKELLKKALNYDAKKIEDAGIGLLGRAYDKLPAVGGYLSGKGEEAVNRLKKYAGYFDDVVAAEKGKPNLKTKVGTLARETSKTAENVAGELEGKIQAKGQQIGSEIDSVGAPIPADQAVYAFENKIAELEKMGPRPEIVKQIETLRNLLENHFADTQGVTPQWSSLTTGKLSPYISQMSGPDAIAIKQEMKPMMDINKQVLTKSNVQVPNTKNIVEASRGAYHSVKDGINKATGTTGKLNQEFEDLMNLRDSFAPFLKDDKAALRTAHTLPNETSVTGRHLKDVLSQGREAGMQSIDDIERVATADQWMNTPWFSRETVPAAAIGTALGYKLGAENLGYGGGGSGALLGAGLGSVLAGPAAVKNYARWVAHGKNKKLIQVPASAISKIPRSLMSRGLYDYLADETN